MAVPIIINFTTNAREFSATDISKRVLALGKNDAQT